MNLAFSNKSSETGPIPEAVTQATIDSQTEKRELLFDLPEKPVVVIEANRWAGYDLKSLWAYRELCYFLIWRDIKVRYKQTVVGVTWVILQPLVTMLIFNYFFGKLAGINSDSVPYALFAYSGLAIWTFFSNAITNSSNSLIGDSNLITKIYFPRMIIPGSAVGSGLIDFAIAFTLLIIMSLFYGFGISLKLLMLPALVTLTVLLALGVGLFLAALNVKYRDVRYALPFSIQVWFFITPIIYPSSLMPESHRWLLEINPMTGIIEGFRSSLFGTAFNWRALSISTIFTVILFLFSIHKFKRLERSFAELI
jgi:lipopolysaccharide transport system permease protein